MSAFTEANREAFDTLSSTYNSKPWQVAISSQVATALQARKDWLGVTWCNPSKARNEQVPVRLLDYACGTGAITKALGPYVTEVRGVDVSEGMVKAFNETCGSLGLEEGVAQAVVGDLVGVDGKGGEELKGSEWYEFDIAVVGLGFHHFEDPALALKRLGERVKAASGVVIVVDFLPFGDEKKEEGEGEGEGAGGDEHSHSHTAHSATIKHSGFDPSTLRDMFVDAGFVDFDIVALKQPAIMELATGTVQRTLFIAKAVKSPTAWQKLTGWIGSVLDLTAGTVQVYRQDGRRWEPGFANSNVKDHGRVWATERVKEEETWRAGADQRAEKKAWNMGF